MCRGIPLILLFTIVPAGLFSLSGCKETNPPAPDRPTESAQTAAPTEPNPTTTIQSPNTAPNPQQAEPDSGADTPTASSEPQAQTTPVLPGGEEKKETGVQWFTDYEAAKQKAAKEDKDLVVNFAGSDWCYWCQQLDKQVFAQEEFASQAEKYFVFVLVDFPNDVSRQSEMVQKQNEGLARQYGFQGQFPSVYLARSDGKQYARTGYIEGGPKAYFDHLMQIRKYK